MANRNFIWYLEPLNPHTNEVIGKNVGEENAQEDVVCDDGERRNLWRCKDYRQARDLLKMNGVNAFLTALWRQENENGKVCPWPPRQDKKNAGQKLVRQLKKTPARS